MYLSPISILKSAQGSFSECVSSNTCYEWANFRCLGVDHNDKKTDCGVKIRKYTKKDWLNKKTVITN